MAFHNTRDAHHNSAVTLMDRFLKLEVTTVLLVRRDLGVATRVGTLLLDGDELDFVPCSDLFSDAFRMFTHQAGSSLSFADAAIAHVAQERAGGLVLTFDAEFGKLPGIRVPAESDSSA